MATEENQLKVKESCIKLIQGDLTTQEVDAIVNAANSSLMGGGGVDGAIHRAGGPRILEECKKIIAREGALAPGLAVITSAGRMPARFVIHTVGPIWMGGKLGEATVLKSAYQESLKIAAAKGLKSIAFPSISTGAYSYPLEKAAAVALKAVKDFLEAYDGKMAVGFVLFNAKTYAAYRAALKQMHKAPGNLSRPKCSK